MKVNIKSLGVDMNIKNKGMEIEIRDPKGVFLGDLVITGTKIIWCKGKTKQENGIALTLEEFIEMMEAQ